MLADYDTRVVSTIDRLSIGNGREQEVNMFLNFSRVAMQMKGQQQSENFSDRYWRVIALLTQLTVDSCMISMKNGGRVTPIDTSMISSLLA